MVSILVTLTDAPPPNVPEQFLINLAAPVPRESVVSFTADLDMRLPEEPLFVMPNIDTLTLGAERVLPGRYIESLLRVFKQLTYILPSG